MALIPLYRAREAQPQDDARLDAKNPLAARFHSAYAPALRSENLSAGGAGEGLQSHAAPAVQLPTAGRAASIVAVNQRLVSGPSFGPTPAYPITMVWIGQQGSTANTQIAGITSAGGIGGSYYYIGGGSSTLIGFSARNNYGSALAMLVAVPGGTALGVELVVVVQSLSANNHRVSVNGSAVATDTTNIGAMVAWDRVFMGQSASANNQATAFFAVASGGAPLTDEQMRRMSRSPSSAYALFEPERTLLWESAGAPAVALAGSGKSAAAGQGSLTTQAALAATGLAAAAGSAALAVQSILQGFGRIDAAGAGLLTVRSALSGAGGAQASGSGLLVTQAALAGYGAASFAGIGAFTVGALGAALAGVGSASASGIGTLATRASLAGAGEVAAQALGTLTTRATLAGAGMSSFYGFGSLGIAGLALAGSGYVGALAVPAALTVRAALSGGGAATAGATAVLGTRAVLSGIGAVSAWGQGVLSMGSIEVMAALTADRRQRLRDPVLSNVRRPPQISTGSRRN